MNSDFFVNSPRDVPTYDLKPRDECSRELVWILVEAIKSDKYDVIVINFANLIWLVTQVLFAGSN